MLHSDEVLEKTQGLRKSGTPFALETVVLCKSPASAKPGAVGWSPVSSTSA